MRNIKLLKEEWQFMKLEQPTDTPPCVKKEAFEKITLPHVWNKDHAAERGCCLYQTSFLASIDADRSFYLAFDAVAGVARVFLNGQFLGEHRGGYSRFCYTADTAIQNGENLLQVLADNSQYDDICPLTGDFTIWGGIYRDVSLIETGKTCFDPTYFGTSGLDLTSFVDGRVEVKARVINAEGAKLRYIVEDGEGRQEAVLEVNADEPDGCLQVEQPHLWDGLKNPYCYTCIAQLWRNGELCDNISLRFGFREISLSSEKGFFLNGNHLKLHGVAKHQDTAGAACAVSESDQLTDMKLIREIGANAVRLSHYQHPQYTYDLCDTMGFVVWAEIPMLAMPEENVGVVENARNQLTELILQNKHHPSICFWGVQNEIAMLGENQWCYEKVAELDGLVKSLDPTRLSAAANLYSVANNSRLNFLNDAVGYNVYFGWYYGKLEDYGKFLADFHRDNPNVALGITEYGVDCNLQYHSDIPECKDYTEEYQSLFHETAYEAIEDDPALWGSFVWNMFDFSSAIRDEGGVKERNCKGLVTYDRQIRKDSFYYYKACWSKEPFVHLAGRRYQNRTVDSVTVTVYSNQDEVTLFVDDDIFASKSGKRKFVFEGVPLKDKTVIMALAGELQDEMLLFKVNEPDSGYIYAGKGDGQRVTNWFLTEAGAQDLTADENFSLSDKFGKLLENPESCSILEEYLPEVTHDERAQMYKGMSLLRILDRSGGSYSAELLTQVNEKLGKVRKKEA